MPSRPPSPLPRTPSTRPTGVTVPDVATCTIRSSSRSLTRADPSGRNVSPHGALSPVATTPATLGRSTRSDPAPADADPDADPDAEPEPDAEGDALVAGAEDRAVEEASGPVAPPPLDDEQA